MREKKNQSNQNDEESLPKLIINSDISEQNSPVRIVGIGASAGGLDALERFFLHVPDNTEMGFVIIQHLSPNHKSLMAELLGKFTTMPVREAQEGWRIEPNAVYLIPSGKVMTVRGGVLHLQDREPKPALSMPIDIFFESLAEDQKSKAVGVVLSGNGSDGTDGLRAIKKNGGKAYAQDAKSAQFTGMPRSALNANLLDFVAIPEELPDAIIKESKLNISLASEITLESQTPIAKILSLLVSQTGVDFTFYKQNTILRRIERRMQATHFASLDDYAVVLSQSPDEIDFLFKDLLIGVTQFFRDTDAFEELKSKAIQPLVMRAKPHQTIRVWIPGCSTGEEAYTIAILFREVINETGSKVSIKIFATDIDQGAIDHASRGMFSEASMVNVSAERKEAFFNQRADVYEIKRYLREMIVFAKQNLLKDPPFSRIDLVSCRNLLIYFENSLQAKVFAIFRFALNQNGFLFLGPSESLDQDRGFQTINAHWRIFEYQRKNKRFSQPPTDGSSNINGDRFIHQYEQDESSLNRKRLTNLESDNLLYKSLLEASSMASVLVDENRNIMHAFGDLQPFLKLPTGGRVELDIVNMAREQVAVPLSTAIHKAVHQKGKIVYKGIRLKSADYSDMVFDLVVQSVVDASLGERFVFVSFQVGTVDDDESLNVNAPIDSHLDWTESAVERIQQLEQELKYSKENLQATIEELETSNEELQATNEELLASNEELQSTNEELQSVNEELLTVNAEYQSKIQELTELNNDISNLFNNTDVGTIFLDQELRIRKFTPVARQEINLIDQDIGRPLSHISHNLMNIDLVSEATAVLNRLIVQEKEVQNEQGIWFMLKIIPYRTLENVIKGVVITLVDISLLKKAQHELTALAESTRQNELKFHQALQFSRIAIFHQDKDLCYSWVYNPFPKFPGYEDKSTIGKSDDDLFLPHDAKVLTDIKNSVILSGMGTRQVVELSIQNEKVIYDLFIEPLEDEKGEIVGVACVSVDITKREPH